MRHPTGLASALVLLSLIFSLAGSAEAREWDGSVVCDGIGQELDETVQRGTKGGFWGAVLVARKGKVLLAKGYGFADYGQVPNTPTTLFEIASLSKQVTAAAILKLEQEGKLKTSDTLQKFFRGLPDDKQDMQVYHLLTHTSGLSSKLGVPYDSKLTRAQYVPHILARPRTHAPGDHFSYSNVGYALLAAIVEVASGQSFEDYCHTHLFEPAGLKATGFIGDKRLLAADSCAARLGNGPREWSAVNWHWGWGYRGMGGVVTTLHDLYAWDRALRGEMVLGAAAKKKLYTVNKGGYACGWKMETSARGTRVATHGGGVMGFRCIMARDLEDDAVIVVLTNDGGDPHQMRKSIEEALFPRPRIEATIDVSAYKLTKYRAAEFGADLAWQAQQADGLVTLTLKDGDKGTPVRIRIPSSYKAKIRAELGRGIAQRMADDPGRPAAAEGGVYLAAYPQGTKKLELNEQLEVTIMPMYRGRGEKGETIIDRRVVFVLNDVKRRMWPLMVKMNVAAAQELLETLK